MSLSEAFNDSRYCATKENDTVLRVTYGKVNYYYDFTARSLLTVYNDYDYRVSGMSTTPFALVDRETLVAMRDKLVELKGNPPELPPEAPATSAAVNKFNL